MPFMVVLRKVVMAVINLLMFLIMKIKSLSSRRKSDSVLIVFYLLNAQYLNKNEASRLDETDEGYGDKGMLGAMVFTPPSNIKDDLRLTLNLH